MTSLNSHARDRQDSARPVDEPRQTRIARLLMELAAIRPARRRDDVARRRSIEAELVLLLDAEILSRRTARRAETASAARQTDTAPIGD
jgi:hypothetical protein